MNVEEIRQKFPMYSDLSDQELVDGMHSKFYSDLPKEEFYKMVGFGGKEKEKTNLLEDLGAGLRGAAETAAVGIGTAAAGLSSLGLGSQENTEQIISDVQARRKIIADREAGLDRGEGGKVLKALGGIPAYLNPVTAGLVIGGGAAETGLRMLDDGSDTGHALAAMGADAGLNMATMGAAQKIGVAGRMANGVLQGTTNVAQEALLNHPVQNAIRDSAGVAPLPDMTPGDYAAAYVPGHVMGHMLPSKGKAPAEVPLDETGVPTRESLDASFVARTEGLVNSIDKQVWKVSEQMDSLVNGAKEGMSEKQRDFWLALSDKRDALLKEKTNQEGILAKYSKGESPVSQEEQIRQLNLDFIDETNKTRLGLDKENVPQEPLGEDPPPLGTLEKPVVGETPRPIDKVAPVFEKAPEVEAVPSKPQNSLSKETPFEAEIEQGTKSAGKIATALEVDNVIDTTKLRSPEELLADPSLSGKDPSSKISREIFGMGQFVEGIKREAPVVWETFKRIKAAYDTEIRLKRLWWSGDASTLKHRGLGPFMTLKHYEDPNTLAEVTPRLSANDKIVVSEFLIDNANKRQRHDRQDLSSFSPLQRKAIELIQKLYDDIQTTTGTRRVNGYIHSIRKGDFAVGLKTTLGDVTHIESFPTKEIATRWAKRAQELGHATTELIDFNTERGATLAESFGIVRDILENAHQRGTEKHNWTMETLDDIQKGMAENATIGKHNVRKSGFSGFEGNKLMKTRKQNGEDFFKSLESYIGEAAVQHKKTLINRSMTDFFESEAGRALAEKFPNQYDTSKYLVDIAMNNQKKYKVAEAIDQIREGVDNLFVKASNKVDALRGKEDRFYYPDVPVVDKTMGMFAQLFYISALTSRIGFTAGQVLTAPFAARQFLKEGSLLDTMLASGKGLGTIMSGGDSSFKSFMKEFVNTTDSTHPQFKNEINELPIFDSHTNKTLSKAFGWATGQTVAGIGDTVSRYMTAATAYHFYKDMGMNHTPLTGKESPSERVRIEAENKQLKSNVQNAVDNTMIMYDRTHTSPFLNRLGLAGQAIAPLQKYGLGALGNLVGDLKFVAQGKGGAQKIRNMAPVISTMLTTMIMAGSIGLPLLMEYEIIRLAFIEVAKFTGWDDVEESIPKSVMESMLTHQNIFTQFSQGLYEAAGASEEFAKDASTHGVVSAATGLDIGSSLRFNPVLPGEGNQQQASLLSLFPVIKSMLDTAVVVMVKGKKLTGADTTEAEQRAADLKIQVFPGQRYLVDKFRYGSDDRSVVPGGNRSYGQVEQTGKEQFAQAFGSSTLETAKLKAMMRSEDTADKKRIAKTQKAIDMIIDGLDTGNQDRTDRGYELADEVGLSNKQIKDQLKAAMHQRNTTREEARITNQKGQVKSYMQRFKADRMEEYK